MAGMLTLTGFQSIGVTKEWRRDKTEADRVMSHLFPINRRHQRMATGNVDSWVYSDLKEVSNQ